MKVEVEVEVVVVVEVEEVAGEVEVGEESHFQFPEKVTSYSGGYISISKGNSKYNSPSYSF